MTPDLLYNKKLNRWEVHYSIADPKSEWSKVYAYMWETFGHPGKAFGDGSWDYHGGWIYFYDEKCVMMYMLRWS